jgi:hypothetical protein
LTDGHIRKKPPNKALNLTARTSAALRGKLKVIMGSNHGVSQIMGSGFQVDKLVKSWGQASKLTS